MAHEVDLESFKELERDIILRVLYRDQTVQSIEEERVRNLKTHLQHLRWKGAKSSSQEYKEKCCARCQRTLGLLLNRGAVCQGCSHRVCSECRVFLRKTHAWKCTVCFEDRNVKIKTGEWFFEERARKFPTAGRRETAGARLLQSYQRQSSKISVVPPTPPPLSESQCGGSPSRLQELGHFRGFNKSVENLFLSVTTQMRKLSKSQNDMTSEKHLLAMDPRQCMGHTERRSQSDTAVNVTSRKTSTPDILKAFHQEDPRHPPSPVLKQDTPPSSPTHSTVFSGGLRHGSLISINSTCTEMGNFDNANVTGEIEFAIHYCVNSHSLEICIKTCKNLAYGEDKRRKCNPYVKTYLLPDRSSQGKRKTRVQKNTLDPTFEETLKILTQQVWAGPRNALIPQTPLCWPPTCRSLQPGLQADCSPETFEKSCPSKGKKGAESGKEATKPNQSARAPTACHNPRYQVDPAQLATRRLQVSVWHLGTLARRVFLGEVILPLATWDFEGSAAQNARWYPLRAKAEKYEENIPQNNGELAVRAKLVLPVGPRMLQEAQEDQLALNGQLCLVVLGAKNLPVRSDGTLNSFVKGCLTLPDQQKLRVKSPVLKKQACPQWKHSFVFNGVSSSQLRQSTLELTVWDQAMFGMNDRLLGEARLGSKGAAPGCTDSCSQSKLQWQKVLSSPNLWTDMTLILH